MLWTSTAAPSVANSSRSPRGSPGGDAAEALRAVDSLMSWLPLGRHLPSRGESCSPARPTSAKAACQCLARLRTGDRTPGRRHNPRRAGRRSRPSTAGRSNWPIPRVCARRTGSRSGWHRASAETTSLRRPDRAGIRCQRAVVARARSLWRQAWPAALRVWNKCRPGRPGQSRVSRRPGGQRPETVRNRDFRPGDYRPARASNASARPGNSFHGRTGTSGSASTAPDLLEGDLGVAIRLASDLPAWGQ